MTNAPSTIARRGLLGVAIIAAILPVAALPAIAQIDGSAPAFMATSSALFRRWRR